MIFGTIKYCKTIKHDHIHSLHFNLTIFHPFKPNLHVIKTSNTIHLFEMTKKRNKIRRNYEEDRIIWYCNE